MRYIKILKGRMGGIWQGGSTCRHGFSKGWTEPSETGLEERGKRWEYGRPGGCHD